VRDIGVDHSEQRSLAPLLSWCGIALALGGVLVVVATALHPSVETPTTILESQVRLVAAHVLYTVAYLLILLGLPALYGRLPVQMGRLGLAGFLVAFLGTTLIAVSGNFGFLAPVLAARSPATIEAISHYPPVVGLNAVAAVAFMVGFVLLGIAMAKTATLPRFAGTLVAVGAPAHLIGFGLSQFVSPSLWLIAILGSAALGAGLAAAGNRIWQPA
jgi:hypothetical protein